MARKLKVFRTPMGFDDAVVAAPSQAAALKAWDVDRNLFGEGLAELVTDEPELEAEALAAPGRVIRRPRGDRAAFDKLPPARPKATKAAKTKATEPPPVKQPKRDRSALDAAEQAVADAKTALEAELQAIRDEIEGLQDQMDRTRRHGEKLIADAEKKARRARQAYEAS